MLKKRLIPVLLLQNGMLVRSEEFRTHQVIGNPIHEVERFNQWNVDELIYIDISTSDDYDQRRDDHRVKPMTDPLTILEAVSRSCFMPLTWGGRIRTLDDIRVRLQHGADKVTLNTAAFQMPWLVTEAARQFGSQAIVVSMDVFQYPDGRREVYIEGGRTPTGLAPEIWATEAERLGAGEILLQHVQRDGTARGYDLDLISTVTSATSIPVIACSGVGRYEDYAAGIRAGASAVAAANIWHFKEMADRGGKRALAKAGIDVRL